MKRSEKILVGAVIAIFALSFVFGVIGFVLGVRNSYDIEPLCSSAGGIWCYWPSPAWKAVVIFAAIVAAVLLVWLFMREKGNKKSRRKV